MTEPDLRVRVQIPEEVRALVDPVENPKDQVKVPDRAEVPGGVRVKVPFETKNRVMVQDAAVVISVDR